MMKRVARWTYLLFTLLLTVDRCRSSNNVNIISNEFQEDVKHLLSLIGYENEYLKFLSYMRVSPPEDNPVVRQMYDELFSSEAYRNDLINIYGQFYSLAEIKSLVDFYTSPVGKKSLKINREMRKQMEDLMLNKISDYIFNAGELGYDVLVSPISK